MRLRFSLFALALIFAAAAPLRAEDSEGVRLAKALSNAYAEIAERVTPSVVALEVSRTVSAEEEMENLPFNLPPEMRDLFRQRLRQRQPRQRDQGMGSGIIVDEKGTILTNNHVVRDAERIKVYTVDGEIFDAEIIGTDPKSDVAVIRLTNPGKTFPAAKLGDSDAIKVGNIVLAIGSPFGLKASVTCGIVSAVNRSRIGGGGSELGEVMYKDFIQTDATINPGNSGGPLVNLDGEVVGINSAISTASRGSDGVGFSIPVNMAKEIMKELIESGSVTRGWLGVSISDFTPEMAQAIPDVKSGVMVLQIFPDTPAAKGGLKFGDIMLSYNGTELKDATHLQHLVARTPVGETAKIDILREGNRMTLEVPIGRQPKRLLSSGPAPESEQDDASATTAKPTSYKSELLGIEAIPLSQAPLEEQEMYKDAGGMLITAVTPDGPADKAGLSEGALLMLVNQIKVDSPESLKKAEESLAGRSAALVHFRMDKQPAATTLELKSTK